MAALLDVLPRTAAYADDGRLGVGGCGLADVAEEFGTPVFVIDEQGLRDTAREYVDAFRSRHAAALAAGVGTIVIDGPDDVDRLERLAPARQAVLLRINPAVPGVTHAAMDTGSADSKFGVSLDCAPALLERIAAVPGLDLRGLHVHYSLLNNYNGTRRPPVVFARGGDARLEVRREEYRDLLARDVL